MKYLSFLFLILVSSTLHAQSDKKQEQKVNKFEKSIETFRRFDDRNTLPKYPVLFVGSSSIVYWETAKSFPELDVINRGFGGASISDILYYYNDVIRKYSPSLMVLYSDIDIENGNTPEEAFNLYKLLLERVSQDLPNTQIIILSMKPTMIDQRLGKDVRKNKIQTNKMLENFCNNRKNFHFLDITQTMYLPDGSLREDIFLSDGMHLNENGYRLWTPIVRKKIDEIITPTPHTQPPK